MQYTAFEGEKILGQGPLPDIALLVKRRLSAEPAASILILNDERGVQVDFDLSGSEEAVRSKLKVFVESEKPEARSGRGRPKLGVVSREVSLLPRQWEWLNSQKGGASVHLRRLVDEARRSETSRDGRKRSQERTHGVMTTLAGDFPGYEEALRALYRNEKDAFIERVSLWPQDIAGYVQQAAHEAFASDRS